MGRISDGDYKAISTARSLLASLADSYADALANSSMAKWETMAHAVIDLLAAKTHTSPENGHDQ